jgi:hypothetical protein
MARLTEHEKAEFRRLAQAPPLRQPPPVVIAFDRYLAALSKLTRHAPPAVKGIPKGEHWKL